MSEASLSSSLSRKERRSKRRPSSWKELPKYLDVATSVSASTFGARRLPEIQRLYNSNNNIDIPPTKSQQNPHHHHDSALKSGGCETSSRHLRRRTNAIKVKASKKRHRYPTGKTDDHPNDNGEDDQDQGDTTKPPPKKKKTKSRKAIRGCKKTLCENHYGWWKQLEQGNNASNQIEEVKEERKGDGTDFVSETTTQSKSSSVNWMMTHLWHTKRFHLEQLWGWKIPLCHINRGSRAVLRLEKERKCTIQDITWKRQPIFLSLVASSNTSSPVESLTTLTHACHRICPDFGSVKGTLCGSIMGNGVLYEIDQFPCSAIGPASWRILSCPPRQQRDTKAHQWTIQWMVHPSIHQVVKKCIQNLVASTSTSDDGFRWMLLGRESAQGIQQQNPMSCFRILGSSATQTLCHVLSVKSPKPNEQRRYHEWDWNALKHLDVIENADSCPPHGALIQVKVALPITRNSPKKIRIDKNQTSSTTLGQEKLKEHLHQVQKAIELWDPNKSSNDGDSVISDSNREDNYDTATTTLMLVRRSPRPLDCSVNHAVSGWDLYISPEFAHDLWMALEMNGSCSSIGMVEESHLYLECNPPIPIFPRDYVDTENGTIYWNDNDKDKRNKAWTIVRRLLEGGWGRLPLKKKDMKLQSVTWNDLLCLDKDENEAAINTLVAIVRGGFGQPFRDVVEGCGRLPEIATSKPKRRKRRGVRPPNETFPANPLSSEEAAQFSQMCQNLQASLSLPAALVCHVRCFGKRSISAGTKLFYNQPSLLETSGQDTCYLGRVTVGEFSISRGICHGIGIIGAARLLQALEVTRGQHAGCIVRQLNGIREVQVTAIAQAANGIHFQVSLSLIL